MARKPIVFTTAAEKLEEIYTLSNIRKLVDEAQQITQLIHDNLPAIRNLCRCGAIVHKESLIVIFVKNNSAFYNVNQYAGQIHDIIYAAGIRYDKIVIKVSANQQKLINKNVTQQKLTEAQRNSWMNLAKAINRKDLMEEIMTEDSVIEIEQDWLELKL